MATGIYRHDSTGERLPGSTFARQATVRAVVKPLNNYRFPYEGANEWICGRLGSNVGLPVPPSGIVYSPSATPTFWFASLDFNLAGERLTQFGFDPQRCVNELPDLATGVLVFDVWIGNGDRERSNLSMDYSLKPPQLDVYDHGNALFSTEGDGRIRQLSEVQDELLVGEDHCLLKTLPSDEYFGKWVTRIRAVPDYQIEDATQDAMQLGLKESEAREAERFLKYRRDNLVAIIVKNRSQFTGVKQWSGEWSKLGKQQGPIDQFRAKFQRLRKQVDRVTKGLGRR